MRCLSLVVGVSCCLALGACSTSKVASQDGAPPKTALGGPAVPNSSQGFLPKVAGHLAFGPMTATPDGPVGPRMLELVNQERAAQGLKPLSLSHELSVAANGHAQDIASAGRLSHFGTDGANPLERVKRAGYQPSLMAENIASGKATVEEALSTWKKSEVHSLNLLLPNAQHMGVGVATDPKNPGQRYWTLVVGARG
jgi:uncharacterized protein YkwD